MSNPIARHGPWQCGFCGIGNHDRCTRGWYTGKRAYPVLPCSCSICAPKGVICLRCGNDVASELDGRKWECHDIDACVATVAARSDDNPLRVKLALVHSDVLTARQLEQRDRILREIELHPDDPNAGHCQCGCGETTKGGKFRPGHDAKLKSRLLKAGDTDELARRGWV